MPTFSVETLAEPPVQFERDLRSAHKEWKRGKTANIKWSYGATQQHPFFPPLSLDVEDDPTFKPRPLGKRSDLWGSMDKDKGNINKYARSTGRIKEMGNSSRVRSIVSAQEEIEEATGASRSILDYLPSPHRQRSDPMDNVLYSFDRTDSPGRPLTLEVFVKTTGRETEKFVEKEYEVIDGNGDALKGRKARQNLRRGATVGAKAADDENETDEDGFELL